VSYELLVKLHFFGNQPIYLLQLALLFYRDQCWARYSVFFYLGIDIDTSCKKYLDTGKRYSLMKVSRYR